MIQMPEHRLIFAAGLEAEFFIPEKGKKNYAIHVSSSRIPAQLLSTRQLSAGPTPPPRTAKLDCESKFSALAGTLK